MGQRRGGPLLVNYSGILLLVQSFDPRAMPQRCQERFKNRQTITQRRQERFKNQQTIKARLAALNDSWSQWTWASRGGFLWRATPSSPL